MAYYTSLLRKNISHARSKRDGDIIEIHLSGDSSPCGDGCSDNVRFRVRKEGSATRVIEIAHSIKEPRGLFSFEILLDKDGIKCARICTDMFSPEETFIYRRGISGPECIYTCYDLLVSEIVQEYRFGKDILPTKVRNLLSEILSYRWNSEEYLPHRCFQLLDVQIPIIS